MKRKKKKTNIDIIKNYNKKIAKTKSPLVYVPIDIGIFKSLTPAEKGQITKILKKFDLRKERRVSGTQVSINTRNLIKTLEKFSNKRIEKFNETFDVPVKKLQGEPVAEQRHLEDEKINTSNIDLKKAGRPGILRSVQRSYAHLKPDFYDARLHQMKMNYAKALTLQLMNLRTDNDYDMIEAGFTWGSFESSVDKLIAHIENMSDEEFYRLYLENIDAATPFADSPTTRKKHEQELPTTSDDIVFENVSRIFGFDEKP